MKGRGAKDRAEARQGAEVGGEGAPLTATAINTCKWRLLRESVEKWRERI